MPHKCFQGSDQIVMVEVGVGVRVRVSDLGQHLHQVTGEARSKEYLLQKLSIAIQWGNTAAVLGIAERDGERDPFWD